MIEVDAKPDWKPAIRFAALMTVLHAVFWATLVFSVVAFVPRFTRAFRDFDMQLPVASEIVVSASELVVAYWYFLPLVGLPLLIADGAVMFGFRLRPNGKVLSNLWAALFLVLPLLLFAIGTIALWLPLLKLQENLSK